MKSTIWIACSSSQLRYTSKNITTNLCVKYFQGADQAREAMDRGDVASIMCCTRCRQRNLRNGRNNHIKCWSCKTNMCFTCKQTIHGAFSTHYALYMPCQQHGDS